MCPSIPVDLRFQKVDPYRPNLSQDSLRFSDELFFKEVMVPASHDTSDAWVSHISSQLNI